MYAPSDEEMGDQDFNRVFDELTEAAAKGFRDESDAEELDLCVLRVLQSAPPGETVPDEDLVAWVSWIKGYQEQRAMIEVVKLGLADVIMQDGEPGLRLRQGDPHPSLEHIKDMRARQREEEEG